MGENIKWHPAFATALKLELSEYYPKYLDIQEEYQLTSKPLEVDILIVKKVKDIKILKNIAEIFEGHNIIEYKSPSDYLSIDDYYKVKSYTYLYKTLTENIDEIKIKDLTITMVSSSYPNKMIDHIEKYQGITIKNVSEGIYYLDNEDVKSQIIVIDELPKKTNRFIRLLTKKINIKDEIRMLLKDYTKNQKDPRYELLLDIVTESNIKQFVEVIEMSRQLTREEEEAVQRVIRKLKLDKKWYAEGKAEGKIEGKAEGKIEDKINVIIKLLNKKFNNMPEELSNKIKTSEDIGLLDEIIDNIFDINTIDDVYEYFKQ